MLFLVGTSGGSGDRNFFSLSDSTCSSYPSLKRKRSEMEEVSIGKVSKAGVKPTKTEQKSAFLNLSGSNALGKLSQNSDPVEMYKKVRNYFYILTICIAFGKKEVFFLTLQNDSILHALSL